MAIHAQMYSDNLGFPLCITNDGGAVDNGFEDSFNQIYFNLQQKQQQQQPKQHLQQRMLPQLQNQHIPLPVALCSNIAAHVDKQRQELDQYIKLQNERLKLLLQEQVKQQVLEFMKRIESKTANLLRQKDEEIARAAKRRMELEEFLRKLEMENQAWQRVAQENEAMVASLNDTIDQMREKALCCFNNIADDAESCCDWKGEEEKGQVIITEKKNFDVEQRKNSMMMICSGCNCRNSCVLFLPCRHLCSCKFCDAVLDSCPVCGTAKKASIEALIV